jgi:hypothetical protein
MNMTRMRARVRRELSTAPQLPQNIPVDAGFLCDKAALIDVAVKRNALYVDGRVTSSTRNVTNFNLFAARQ